MDVRDLHAALTERGIHVVVKHGIDRQADVDITLDDDPERLDDEFTEEQHINATGTGLLVRRSGWVWILGTTGDVVLGLARDSELDRQRVALDIVRDILTPVGVTDEAPAEPVAKARKR